MGFNQKLLNENEEVLLDLRPHWWFITPQAAAVALALILAIVAAVLTDVSILIYIMVGLLVLTLIALGLRWLQWRNVNFVITTDRLIFRTGVVSKEGIEIPLERINTVFYSQSVFERMVSSGDLSVESAGEGGQQHFDNVRRPQSIQQEIYRAMEINKNQGFAAMAQAHVSATPAPQGAARDLSIPEQIEQLDQLRLRGVITEQEFQTKKSDLLDRM